MSLTRLLEHLGPAFIKIGQVLSTRHDLLPSQLLAPLGKLQDRVHAFPADQVRWELERHLGHPLDNVFVEFADTPIASASIAQIHLARLRSGDRQVVVKLKRPGIDRLIAHDTGLLLRAVRCTRWISSMRDLPLVAVTQQVCDALKLQTDLKAEARAHQHFYGTFSSRIRIPELLPEYCTSEFLMMEYLPGMVKVTDPLLSERARRNAVSIGLRALYEMIFCTGLIHCDLHPGNMLCIGDGQLALLDFGFWAQLPDGDRLKFAEFFLSVALNDGQTAARIVCSSAVGFSARFDREAFEVGMADLIERSSRLQARQFLVSEFVIALFTLQRRHGVVGSPAFTMAIVSLLVFEGIARPLHPDLDFQREAVPFLFQALA